MKVTRITLVFFLVLVAVFAIVCAASGSDNNYEEGMPAVSYAVTFDFEDVTPKVKGIGEKTSIGISEDFACEGSHSLKVENRVSEWDGCEVDLTDDWKLMNGFDFEVSANVYHTSSSPQLFKIVAYTKDDSGEHFNTIVEKVVMPNFWKKVVAGFTPRFSEPVEKFSLMLFFPLDVDFTYYVDKVEILCSDMVEVPGIVLKDNFEENTGSWQPRGESVSIETTDKVAHGGKKSLYVGGRQSGWHGAQIDVREIMEVGKSYDIEVWVYQETGENQQITLTMQRKYASDAETHYDTIAWQKTVPSGEWTKLTGSYTVKPGEKVEELIFYIESPNVSLDFYIDDVLMIDKTVPKLEPEWEIPDLKGVYQDNFKMGVAIPYKVLMNPLEMEMVEKHFNSITAENEMKPESLLNSLGQYKFSVADEYVNFAQEKGIEVRGHTLVWHSQTPSWFFEDEEGNPVSKEVLLERMENYIHDIVGHFAGKIYAWDVVNEAIDPDRPDGFRRSKWYEIIGPEYIEYAFKFAHEADPDAKLFYNDYNTFEPKKMKFIYDMVYGLKEKGIPIDGIGMQLHIGIGTNLKQVEEAINLFSSIPGIEIHATEIDMSIYTDQFSNFDSPPYEALVAQGKKFEELFEILKRYDETVTSVTFWGLKDDYSWKSQTRNDWPLLFDKDYQSKYAYWGIVEPKVVPVIPKKTSITQGTAIPLGMMDDSYLFSRPIQIFDEEGKKKLNSRMVWDKNTIYIYGDVQDQSKDPKDGVAIFLDPNNAKTPYLQEDDVWVIIRNDWTIETNKDDIPVQYFVGPGARKYSFECSITLPTQFEKGQLIGFDIAVIDGEKTYSWSDSLNKQMTDTSRYGIVALEGATTGTAKYGTPVIDGEIDEIWSNAELYSTTTVISGTLNNAVADFRLLWDESALYVLAKVKDANLNKDNQDPWEQDSIEFFIDENNNKTGFYESDDAQYRVNYLNEQSFGTGASAANFKTASKIVDNGYLVEAAISWKTITPTPGHVIGFDVQVNDADGSGKRVGIITWSDPTGNNWQSTVNFGNIVLEK